MGKVLLVEPDAVLREQYARKMSVHFEVQAVASAQEALDMLDHTEQKVDLVITDITLGSNNGIEILHEVKSYDDWMNIPIILLSSVPLSRLPRARFERYGISELLYKPTTSPRELLKYANRAIVSV